MKRKQIFTFVSFFICLFINQVNAQKLELFNNSLKPVSQELEQQLKGINRVGSILDGIITTLEAKAYIPKASQEAKTNLAAFILKKAILQREQPYESNEPLLLEASELVPNNFFVEATWGDMLFFVKNYENSIPHYENALNRDENNYEIIGKCGLAYMYILRYEKALEYIENYLSKYPKNFNFLYSAGRCHFDLNNYDEAIDYWETALENTTDPSSIKTIEELLRKAKEALASTSDSSQEEDQRFVITFAGNSQEDLSDITFDILNEIYYDVTSLLGCDPDVRINVVFFLTEDYYKLGQDWSAAGAQGIQIMIPLKSGYKSEEYVKGLLAHEFTHTIINLKTNNRAPLWVHEGLAQYQEYATSYGSPDVLRPDFSRYMENDFIEKGLFISLSKIPAYIGSSNKDDVARGYVAAYSAIRCMADYYGEGSFDTLLSAIGRGKSIQEAVKEATGRDYNEFQDEVKDWIKNQ